MKMAWNWIMRRKDPRIKNIDGDMKMLELFKSIDIIVGAIDCKY